MDNTTRVKDIDGKIIILDGTADLSPEYTIDPYDIRSTDGYGRRLDYLKIRIINIPTSKNRLNNEKARTVVKATVAERYRRLIKRSDKVALFTYQDYLYLFEDLLPRNQMEYFGNIIGKNTFREANHIFQVGLNRFPGQAYYLYALAHHPGKLAEHINVEEHLIEELTEDRLIASLTTLSDEGEDLETTYLYDFGHNKELIEEQSELIRAEMMNYGTETRQIMLRTLLAELEQNMFRGVIRNSSSTVDYTFHLFIDAVRYADLIQMMEDRYLPLGAEITVEEIPAKIQLMKSAQHGNARDKASILQRIIQWHDKILKEKEEYTPDQLRAATGISRGSYETLRHRHPELVKMMDAEKQKRGIYRRKGLWGSVVDDEEMEF